MGKNTSAPGVLLDHINIQVLRLFMQVIPSPSPPTPD